ncbi:hypothetical protein MF672_045365 [Actinomadura sp. ATCC 31491]|uniref:Uncharacterized protein n=1 Tax=Actinomadura luzonensis TaxID=2805427 RepID=A0ABT0G8R3_9ACTN|nr:hypothetical protein [Actinomadura luzonensis]
MPGQQAGPGPQAVPDPYAQGTPAPYGQTTANPYGQNPAHPYGQSTPNPYAPGGAPPYTPNPYNQAGPPPYGQPPKQRNNGLIIGLCIALGVLLLGGGTIGTIVYVNNSDKSGTTTAALSSPTPTTLPSQSQSQSAAPSAEPSQSATTDPDPTPSSTASAPSSADAPLRHDEFNDWNFSLGSVKFSADKVAGWTYDDCDAVDGEGVLAKYHCKNAVQLAYSSYSGHLKAVQLIMAFPSNSEAKNAANRLQKLTSDAVKWRTDKTHKSYAYGKILSGSVLKYVLVTIVTADNSAKSKATKFQAYLQTDHAQYFLDRGHALTS